MPKGSDSMTEKLVIKPRKDIILTGMEGPAIKEDLAQEFLQARRRVEDRWGVSITLEAV